MIFVTLIYILLNLIVDMAQGKEPLNDDTNTAANVEKKKEKDHTPSKVSDTKMFSFNIICFSLNL